MNIIIPVGGKGERFKNCGYKTPKPLIQILGKPMIFHVLDNLNITKDDNIYIIFNTTLESYNFSEIILKKYPDINICLINKQTAGAAETIYEGLKNIQDNLKNRPNIILDCDTIYKANILDLYRNYNNNSVFYFETQNEQPIYSYIMLDNQNKIVDIKEKNKITNNANTGAYCFEKISDLLNYCNYIITNKIFFKNEPYTSCVISEMIKNDFIFQGIQISKCDMISLGTPEQVTDFINTTNLLLFDLDGTLVNTDHIYQDVWKQILKQYNIHCNMNLFNCFIKGKSDNLFLKYLIPDITNEKINEISQIKDELFIKYSSDPSKYLFDGVKDFFFKYSNNPIAIVTSCNKSAAQHILKTTGLYEFVDLIISAEDCVNHKPHPEPYITAINFFKPNIENVFIFEDSYSGLCSAVHSGVKNISLILNEHSSSEILESSYFKFSNYKTLNLMEIKNFYNKEQHNENLIIEQIKENINSYPISDITKNNDNLKTGYICDIESYKITYLNNETENIVIKISNLDNELSETATKLNMYSNETFFYEKLSSLIPYTPNFFGSFKYNSRDAIVLEDLRKYNGIFNINLNNDINNLLKVVNQIHNLHKTFYFKEQQQINDNIRSLKKINEITYYKELIYNRFDKFIENIEYIVDVDSINIFKYIYDNIDNIFNSASQFPLSLCHGDLKSPNIFYKENKYPILLDWQYIHLNKGISDIVFLLIESIDFDIVTVNLVINYYFKLQYEFAKISYKDFMSDFKNALCIFPFFVCVWFNSENPDKLLDPVFPLKFLKNLVKYYNYFIQLK